MKLNWAFRAIVLTQGLALGLPSSHPPVTWKAAGLDDKRGPCPMLNALANHGHLPHDGKDISEEQTINALGTALNIDEGLSKFFFRGALTTNPEKNATTFSLDDLSRHNILEHDASLSRQDHFFGDDHSFNQDIFDETRSHWTDPINIDIDAAARARQARVDTSNATNPTFTLTSESMTLSYGESAAYILVFGNKTTGIVTKSWVEYLFEHERLPVELGWTKRQESISTEDVNEMSQRIIKATSSSTGKKARTIEGRDVHAGQNARL